MKMMKMKNNEKVGTRLSSKIAKSVKIFACGTLLVAGLMLLPGKAKADESRGQADISARPAPTLSVKTGGGIDLLSKSPRATTEFAVSHPLPMGFSLGTDFGIASAGSFDKGTQPGIRLEQMDLALGFPGFGPIALSAYMQNSTHLGTVLTGGGNAFVNLGPLFGVVGIQKNIEGPLPAYAVLGTTLADTLTLSAGFVDVLNAPVIGGRVSATVKTAKISIPEIYMDLFMLGTPATRQIILQDLTVGLKFGF